MSSSSCCRFSDSARSFPTDQTSTRKSGGVVVLHHLAWLLFHFLFGANIKHQHVNTPQEAPGAWHMKTKRTCSMHPEIANLPLCYFPQASSVNLKRWFTTSTRVRYVWSAAVEHYTQFKEADSHSMYSLRRCMVVTRLYNLPYHLQSPLIFGSGLDLCGILWVYILYLYLFHFNEDSSVALVLLFGGVLKFAAFLYTGRKTPTTDEVCDALQKIRTDYPHLEATDVSDLTNKTAETGAALANCGMPPRWQSDACSSLGYSSPSA